MLFLPKLKNGKKKTKKFIYSFGGINNSGDFQAGELEDSVNISLDKAPYITVGKAYSDENTKADDILYANGIVRLLTQEDGSLMAYYRAEKLGTSWNSYSTTLSKGKKEVATAGKKVIIMPDKKVLDLSEIYPTWKDMEKTVSYSKQSALLFSDHITFNKEADFTTFKDAFKEGDAITFTGGYYEGNVTAKSWQNKKLIIREITNSTQKQVFFDTYSFGEAYGNENTSCTFKKTVPSITNICSWNDRVWGVSSDGKIYGSKYQDPTNFEYFDLTSADSFTLEVGSGGAFTGSCATASYVAFFRENKIHRITGTKPSNYRHTVINQSGVKSGSNRSLAVICDLVYYEGKDGFYVFDGVDTRLISKKLGDITHSGGVGVGLGNKYYICFKDAYGRYNLYIYNIESGVWIKSGIISFKAALCYMGNIMYLDLDGNIKKITDNKSAENFSVVLRELENDFSEQKGFMRLYLGYSMNYGGKITCDVSYNKEAFQTVAEFSDYSKTVSEIRFSPNRKNSIRIRLSATPDVQIKSLMREIHTHGSMF